DDHVGAFRTQLLRHLSSSLSRIGEGDGARIYGELNGVGPHYAEKAEPDAATLQQHVAANQSRPGQFLEAGKPRVVAIEMRIGRENRRQTPGPVRRRHCLGESIWAAIELVIADRYRIFTRHRQALEFRPGLLDRRTKGCTDA